jgi:hypothetical protein
MTEHSVRDVFASVLKEGGPAASLDDAVSEAFPSLTAFREEDDLVLLAGDTRRLLVRRVGPDRFRTSENAAASGSTNLLDADEGDDRDLDGLIEEIAAFAAV